MPSSFPQPRPLQPAAIATGSTAPLAGMSPVEVLAPEPRPLRVALAHDWLCGLRGGEKVLEHIARVVLKRSRDQRPKSTPLYLMFDDGRPILPHIDQLRRIASPLMRIPAALKLRRWLLPLYPTAVGALSDQLARDHAEQPFDLLISTSSAAIKGLKAPPGVPHLCYCHSPARYVWSQRDQSAQSALARFGLVAYSERFKGWDRATSQNVTRFIANSAHTAQQIRQHFGRTCDVLHPPVGTGFYTPGPSVRREDFWLVVGALEPYKRTDLAIEAAALAKKRLVVVGTGSARRDLQRRAAARIESRVEFLGRVPDEKLRDLYRRAELLLFPQIEDFGIIAAEALACGLPVVARRAGGALDIVTDGRNGTLFDDPTPAAVVAAAVRMSDRRDANTAAQCRARAEEFSIERFERGIAGLIDATLIDATVGERTPRSSV